MTLKPVTDRTLYRCIAAYLRHSPISKGRYRLATHARSLGRLVARQLGHRRIKTRHGFAMDLDLRDWIPQEIYLTGEFEPTTTAILRRLLKPGDITVDVGANIGYFSLLFAKCVGSNGLVYSYEPVPALADTFRKNVELNGFKQVSLSNLALSDRAGATQFYKGPEDNSGLSSLREPRDSSGTIDITMARFDSIFNDAQDIALVKIDVEGAELAVLRGMAEYFRSRRPDLLVEITDKFLKEMGDSEEGLLAYLQTLDYHCYLIGDGRIDLISTSHATLPSQWNALFSSRKLFGDGMALY